MSAIEGQSDELLEAMDVLVAAQTQEMASAIVRATVAEQKVEVVLDALRGVLAAHQSDDRHSEATCANCRRASAAIEACR